MAKVASPRVAAAAGDRGADAAVGVVPRQGVRLARDAVVERPGRVDRGAVRARDAGLRARRHHDHAGLPVAAVHDPADLRRPRAGARTRCSRPRPTSAPARGRRCGGWCCRWCSRRSSPGRSSPSRCRMGDYIAVKIVGGTSQLLGNVVYDNQGAANNLPFAAAVATIPIVVMLRLPRRRPPYRRAGAALMRRSHEPARRLRVSLTVITVVVLVFIYVPLLLVLLNSFNTDRTFGWPPPGYTLHWWELAWHSQGARDALWTSVRVAIAATVVALVLGTLAAMGLRRDQVLRSQRRLAADHPADRAARHRHRTRVPERLPHHPRHPALALDHRDRARDVLHRHGVQQRAGALPAARRQPRAGLDGPRRRPASRRSG